MNLIEIKNLKKEYPNFLLNDVSFSLKKGYIMGFIGENGAGKTTTLKSMLNIIKRDSGNVKIFNKEIDQYELDIKKEIAFMSGDTDFYPKSKLKDITKVFRRFFEHWDNDVYDEYLKLFNLDPNKKISELSKGMKMKYSLTLALSHKAKLLILDEPTSGLDPVARDGLLEIFQQIVEDGEVSILFSTHITSDLEKCADYITFISNGMIIESCSKDDLIDSYRLVNGTKEYLNEVKQDMISYKENTFGFTGLIKSKHLSNINEINIAVPTLDDIMIYYSNYGGL